MFSEIGFIYNLNFSFYCLLILGGAIFIVRWVLTNYFYTRIFKKIHNDCKNKSQDFIEKETKFHIENKYLFMVHNKNLPFHLKHSFSLVMFCYGYCLFFEFNILIFFLVAISFSYWCSALYREFNLCLLSYVASTYWSHLTISRALMIKPVDIASKMGFMVNDNKFFMQF